MLKTKNINKLHYLDVLHGRLLGSNVNFHWQLGGYNNHQPCSSNDTLVELSSARNVLKLEQLDKSLI